MSMRSSYYLIPNFAVGRQHLRLMWERPSWP